MRRFFDWLGGLFGPRAPEPNGPELWEPAAFRVGVAEAVGGAEDGRVFVGLTVIDPDGGEVLMALCPDAARDLSRRMGEAADIAAEMAR